MENDFSTSTLPPLTNPRKRKGEKTHKNINSMSVCVRTMNPFVKKKQISIPSFTFGHGMEMQQPSIELNVIEFRRSQGYSNFVLYLHSRKLSQQNAIKMWNIYCFFFLPYFYWMCSHENGECERWPYRALFKECSASPAEILIRLSHPFPLFFSDTFWRYVE